MSGASGRPWRTTLLVLGAGLILFFPGLGNHGLWNPNEPVFAEGAREMMVRGEWLVPYVNGRLYVDKPILYFWAILAGSLPGGAVTPLAARLPSAVASLLTLWVVVRFARREFGERAALFAGIVLATTPVFWWEARFAQMDPMLVLFMLLCLICFHRAREERAAWWLAASGAWAGLAFLTKGPVGLVLPGAAALVVLALDRDLRFLLRPAWVAGAAAFVIVGAPWYLAVHLSGHPDYLEEFFLRQNVTRFVDPFDHARPFYYYAVRFVSDLFPWSLFLPGVLLAGFPPGWKRRDRAGAPRPVPAGPGERAASAWWLCVTYAAVTVLFFSTSGAKRGVYILPLYPAYALLVGWYWSRLEGRLQAGDRAGGFRITARIAAAVLGVLGLVLIAASVLPLEAVRPYAELRLPAGLLGATFLAGGTGAWVAGLRRVRPSAVPRRVLAALAGSLAAAYLVAGLWIVPSVDPRKSARRFSERITAHAGSDAPIRSFRFWKWRSEYIFYTGRLMPILDHVGQVESYFSSSEPVYLLVEESERETLEGGLAVPYHRLETADVGGKKVSLYSNRPADPPRPG